MSMQNGVLDHDHAEWGFVDYMLMRFDLREKWVAWIRECIALTSFFVFVNGFRSRLFKASRGLRQGVSLSLFFFIYDHGEGS